MKKIFMGLMTVLLVIGLVGCGTGAGNKPKNVSDEVYKYGVAVVKAMDKYLDDEISAYDVAEKIFIDGLSFSTDEEVKIENAVIVIWEGMSRYPDDKEKTIEFRNELADLLNLEARE